jgi:hypothetical protein
MPGSIPVMRWCGLSAMALTLPRCLTRSTSAASYSAGGQKLQSLTSGKTSGTCGPPPARGDRVSANDTDKGDGVGGTATVLTPCHASHEYRKLRTEGGEGSVDTYDGRGREGTGGGEDRGGAVVGRGAATGGVGVGVGGRTPCASASRATAAAAALPRSSDETNGLPCTPPPPPPAATPPIIPLGRGGLDRSAAVAVVVGARGAVGSSESESDERNGLPCRAWPIRSAPWFTAIAQSSDVDGAGLPSSSSPLLLPLLLLLWLRASPSSCESVRAAAAATA